MNYFLADNSADPSARIMALPFTAMAVTPGDVAPFTHGMPAAACEIDRLNLVVAATPCSAPLFRDTIEGVAARQRRDVLLIRTGLFPETLNPVSCDMALLVGDEVLLLKDFSFMRDPKGGLWLVPPHGDCFLQVTEQGLRLDTIPPFLSYDERADGLSLAASEIVRIATRRGVR